MSSLERKFSTQFWVFRWTPIFVSINGFDEHLFVSFSDELGFDVNLAFGLLLSHGHPFGIQSYVISAFAGKPRREGFKKV